MANEHSTLDRNLIGRRQALCTFAGIATAVAGIGLFGIGTAQASQTSTQAVDGQTVSAAEATRQAEEAAKIEHEMTLVNALIPAGLDVGRWSIEKVHAPRFGAVAVVMRTPEGAPFQVDVLRRDGKISGVAETEQFSLFIADGGDGSTNTDEWQARGVKVLAHHLRRTERSGTPLPKLMSFSERSRRHPFGDFSVLG